MTIDFTPLHEVWIRDATFICEVHGKDVKEMGDAAWKACKEFYGDVEFEITSIDTQAVQTNAMTTVGYIGTVRARAK